MRLRGTASIHICSGCKTLNPTSMLVQGEHWNWFLQRHRDLDKALLDVLAAIHSRGVVHGDLHKSNILVTTDRRIVILDFAAAQLQASPGAPEAEMLDLARRLAQPVQTAPIDQCFK